MSCLPNRATWIAVIAGIVVAALPQTSHAAGLFEYLFGGFAPPAPRYEYGLPLDVRVNPHHRKKAVANRAEPKAKLQTAIDPVTNPSWYLDDPTLRRGDIVVLKGRALVYDGGRGERSIEDFTSIQKSTLISKAEREKIERMSKGNAGLTVAATPASSVPVAGREAALR